LIFNNFCSFFAIFSIFIKFSRLLRQAESAEFSKISNAYFFCDEAALGFVKSGFLLSKLVCDRLFAWYVRQFFTVLQSFFQLVCFLDFSVLISFQQVTLLAWGGWRASRPLDGTSERSQSYSSPTRSIM